MRIIQDMNRDWRFSLGEDMENTIRTHSEAYQFVQAGSIKGIPSVNYDDSCWALATAIPTATKAIICRRENFLPVMHS